MSLGGQLYNWFVSFVENGKSITIGFATVVLGLSAAGLALAMLIYGIGDFAYWSGDKLVFQQMMHSNSWELYFAHVSGAVLAALLIWGLGYISHITGVELRREYAKALRNQRYDQ